MNLAEEIALAFVLALFLLPLAAIKSPDIAEWADPLPSAISNEMSIAFIPIPELKPEN